MRPRRGFFFGIGLAVVLVATIGGTSTARAQATNAAAAEALFNEGRQLLQNGNVEQACDRFSRSDQLDPAVGTELNLGECLERLGKVASAWIVYRRAVSLGDARSDVRRATRARAAAASLESRLPRLTITVGGTASAALPPGLVVTCNGAPIEPAALRTPVPVDPGTQTIEASAPNRKPWRTTVNIAEASAVTVEIPTLATLETRETTTVVEPLPSPPPSNTQRTIGIGLEIGGGAVLAAGLVLGALVIVRWGSVEDTCPNAKCPSEAARKAQSSDADAARTLGVASTISTIVGAAALAGGIVLHLTAPPRHDRMAVGPMLGASALGLTLTFDR